MTPEQLSKIVTEGTQCRTMVVTSTSFVKPTSGDKPDVNIKCVEVKNTTGQTLLINPNRSEPFPLLDAESRLIFISKLSDIEIARESGSGPLVVYLIYEI